MTRSLWMIWAWPTSNEKCSYKKHSGDLVDTRAGALWPRRQRSVMSTQSANSRSHRKQEVRGGVSPRAGVRTLILAFRLPELWENKHTLFSDTHFMAIWYSSHRKPIQMESWFAPGHWTMYYWQDGGGRKLTWPWASVWTCSFVYSM